MCTNEKNKILGVNIMITDEEFKKIKQEYKSSNIEIGVDLSLTRKNMNAAGNTISLIWSSSFTLMIILSFFIRYILHRNLWNFIWNSFRSVIIFLYRVMFNQL